MANSNDFSKVATAFCFCRRYSSSGVRAGRMRAERWMTFCALSTTISEMHFLRRAFFWKGSEEFRSS